jgi:reductive dehalogenase
MKALGLAGAGIGAAAATTPVFHDLDELTSSQLSVSDNPWYVKEQDEPTTEIDWSMVQRHDGTSYNLPPEKLASLVENREILIKQWAQEGKKGFTQRDLALHEGIGFPFTLARDEWGWTGPTKMRHGVVGLPAHTPEVLGMPKYQGTPEEHLLMLRAAIRFYGGSNAYATELNENKRKCVWTNTNRRGPEYVFEDVDKAYQTDTTKVIPYNCDNVLVWPLVQAGEMGKMYTETASYHHTPPVFHAYFRIDNVTHQIQRFITILGYQYLPDRITGAGSFATLAGHGELCRGSYNCSPIYGTSVRVPTHALTDMPLAKTKPVDAGIFKFCHSCQRCADICPSGAVQTGDPSWDLHGPYNATGYYAWRPHYEKCQPHRGDPGGEWPSDCGMCQSVCVFSKGTAAGIHDIVKGTVATTSIFNGFFSRMDEFFGYPDKDPEDFWNTKLPVYGIDSNI